MSDAVTIGRNIKEARTEVGLTQREVEERTGISASQLSAYENGRQMVGLVTLGKLASALGTSIDRLYFGKPSEAFLNQSADFGETVVYCFRKLEELGVVNSVYSDRSSYSADLRKCGQELDNMFSLIKEFERRKDYYPDPDTYLEQIYASVANQINKRYPNGEEVQSYAPAPYF